jgi:hypothetical protein
VNNELNSKRILLIDGIGALATSFLLVVVLIYFESSIGMPRHVLCLLVIFAGIFALYSLSGCFLGKGKWKNCLLIIAILNLSYCLVSIGLMIYYFYLLTILGVIYFSVEIILIISLAIAELAAFNFLKKGF